MKSFFPIPADALIGIYHPFRDFFVGLYSRGFPFKNFLITDPVRQQYPWRFLAIESWEAGRWPGWNPYQFTGMPLLANFQTAVFYPLNILFSFFSFNAAWALLIFLQPLLTILFTYLLLRHFKLGRAAALLGGLAFAFSGFMVVWFEWGTIGHTALWLPLILLAIDKIIARRRRWSLIFVFSLIASFFAGHLQTAFYVILTSLIYIIWQLSQIKKNKILKQLILVFSFSFLVFSLATAIQWLSSLRLIELSARAIDLDWHKQGWFLPWQHLIQFFVPDFFGNPTTLNYWGEWNYAEFAGFLGVIPLILSFLAISNFRKSKIIRFFTLLAMISLSFTLPTPWAKLIYQLKIPFLATSQPTRLLFLVDFSLAILAAFGFQHLITSCLTTYYNNTYYRSKRKLLWILLLISCLFVFLWLFTFSGQQEAINLLVARRNLILPTLMLVFFWLLAFTRLPVWFLVASILVLTIFDISRFAKKFTPFSPSEFIFPKTAAIEFLQDKQENNPPFRIMAVDDRILPPNFSSVYHLEDVSGYDPLYLQRYGELIAALEREKPDISPPFGFNRIITPSNYQSKLIDFLNVRYILSLNSLESEKLEMVFEEGKTKIYENKKYFSRAFLVNDYRVATGKQEAIDLMMSEEIDLAKIAILEQEPNLTIEQYNNIIMNSVEIINYTPHKIELQVKAASPGLLVLTDSFYPGWRAVIRPLANYGDAQQAKIYRANYHYRAIMVPKGEHRVVFSYLPWLKN